MKLNEQRFATIVILCNVLDTEEGVTDHIKSAVCASLINMLERSMNDDDTPLVNLINKIASDGHNNFLIDISGVLTWQQKT